MKRPADFAVPLFALALCITAQAVYADGPDKLGPYKQIATVTVPSGLAGGFDISWVDTAARRYYLADRGNAKASPPVAPGIDVISTKHPKFLFEIELPTSKGTNGVLVFHGSGDDDSDADASGTLVAGGNDSNAYFVDLANPSAAPIMVSTGGKVRADELAYDPKDQLILITNPDEGSAMPPESPFVTFISTKTHLVLGKIVYDGGSGQGHGPSAAGIEQPVWDGAKGKFYINITSTPANPQGELDEIDPSTMAITNTFSTPCPAPFGPLGLALIPGQRLMNSCGDVFDIATSTIVKTQTGIIADEIWYNPGDERVYFGGITGSPVVEALPPYDLIPGGLPWTGTFPTHFSHSVAVDSIFNHSFVPVSNTGVLVFTDDHDYGEGPKD